MRSSHPDSGGWPRARRRAVGRAARTCRTGDPERLPLNRAGEGVDEREERGGGMDLLQALGVAAPAGLNAYLTLLLVGLAGRFGWIELSGTWGERLTNPYILGVLALLTVWEIAVDKVPGADHLNDVAGTVIRPLAGAVLMLAHPNPLSENAPVAAVSTGIVLAGGLHALKALLRPVVTIGTAGFGTPVISAAEDTTAAGMVAVAIIAPVLVIIVLALLAARLWWAARRWRLRRRRRAGAL
jgi:uncharacterized membrane protein